MRPASLLLPPDRQNDDTDPQQKQGLHWERHREQDAGFCAPGNSAAAHQHRDHQSHQSHQSLQDRQNRQNRQNRLEDGFESSSDDRAAVMTHVPVGGDEDEDPEFLPDFDALDYPDQDHDLDMSDSDGGAPLDSVLIFSDLEYDDDDPFPQQEEDEDKDEDEEEEEEDDDEDDDDETAGPTSLAYFALPPDFHLHMHDPVGSGLITDLVPPPELWTGLPTTTTTTTTTVPNTPPPPPVPQILDETFDDPLPPVQLSNPNPSILGSENLGLVDFLRGWAYGQLFAPNLRLHRPDLHQVLKQARTDVEKVRYSDLEGDSCDLQGLDWESMDTTREAARQRRRFTYKNYVNKPGSDNWNSDLDEESIPSTDNFFRFRRMDIRRDVSLAHFQLRSVLACPSRTLAFYPSNQGINMMNTVSRKTDLAMNLREFPGMTSPAISTLDAACGVVMGGTFNGDYCLQALGTEDKKNYSEGQISTDISGITNHIRIYRPRRSYSPVAAIASNDHGFRVMDLQTEKFVSDIMYPFALNCSAISPDGRLRVLVGDNLDVLITNADTGETLQKLSGHRDYGFACDWSDNGFTVATGFQDKGIKIWDARRWCNSSGVSMPLCTIRAEMAGVRSLRFSPAGSGSPVLVAAEEADFINIIDAQTFCSKQTVDVFGEIGGVAFANEGQDLNILCCDSHRGGLLQLERCGYGVVEPVVESWSSGWDDDDDDDAEWHRPSDPIISPWRNIPPYLDGPGPF